MVNFGLETLTTTILRYWDGILCPYIRAFGTQMLLGHKILVSPLCPLSSSSNRLLGHSMCPNMLIPIETQYRVLISMVIQKQIVSPYPVHLPYLNWIQDIKTIYCVPKDYSDTMFCLYMIYKDTYVCYKISWHDFL